MISSGFSADRWGSTGAAPAEIGPIKKNRALMTQKSFLDVPESAAAIYLIV
jgi:hypothetical protein